MTGAGLPGIAGNPFAATVSGTSVLSAMVGYRLGGIAAPVVTHATNAFVNADRIGALGAGFAGSSQPLAAVSVVLNPPRPPPCVMPGKK